MKISLNWIKSLTSITWPPELAAEKLAELGFPVDAVTFTGIQVKNIITAKILSVEKHPQADRLSITKVFDGKSERVVVCGAPNVAAGQIVPLAVPGVKFPNGLEISVAKIRGVESHGMLCSEKELGLSESHAGILELPSDTPIGKEINSILGESDVVFDVDVTPNRPDALSHMGIARELAAVTKKTITPKKPTWKKGPVLDKCQIKIEAPNLCHRYLGKIFSGVKIGPSPDWMVRRLSACGIRSINNIVDITNYVLLEWGHPLHAFDLNRLDGKKIVVRQAKTGESLQALDEKSYPLTPDDLVIADGKGPVAIAGIMGGEYSGVTENTNTILLESAVFDPRSVRRTSRRLGLKSESSVRFEKGSDVQTAEMASIAAAQLIMALTGGKPGDAADAYPKKYKPTVISLSFDLIEQVLGCSISVKEIETIFKNLQFSSKKRKDGWDITVPSYRKDIKEPYDVVEEVARIYGFNRIPSKAPAISLGHINPQLLPASKNTLRSILKGWGLSESITSSFVGPDRAKKFTQMADQFVSLANPLSQEESILRPMLLPNLLTAVQKNSYAQRNSVKIFEIGKEFTKGNVPGHIGEKNKLALVIFGELSPKSVHENKKDVDFYFLKGLLEELFSLFHANVEFKEGIAPSFLHPSQSISIVFRGKSIGVAGMLHPNFMDLNGPCAVAEIDLGVFQEKKSSYSPFSKVPAVERDMAIVLDQNVPWRTVIDVVSAAAGKLLVKIYPFDIFVSESLGLGKKSLAFRMTFQHIDKTLTEQEINTLVDSVRLGLKAQCGADVR